MITWTWKNHLPDNIAWSQTNDSLNVTILEKICLSMLNAEELPHPSSKIIYCIVLFQQIIKNMSFEFYKSQEKIFSSVVKGVQYLSSLHSLLQFFILLLSDFILLNCCLAVLFKEDNKIYRSLTVRFKLYCHTTNIYLWQ